jgi:hypothetical protein
MSKIIVDQIQKLTVPSSPSVLAVINSGSGSYTINSVASNPTLTLVRGSTYTFNVNAAGHPFHIQTVNSAYSSADVYTSGVTNPGASVGTITFTVPGGAPNTLYYVCQNHGAMRGTINIINNTASAFNIPATDGTIGQYMKTDGSQNLGWASMEYTGPQSLTAIPMQEGKGIIGSIVTHTDRQNTYSSEEWTTGPWTTFYNYAIESDNHAIQFWNMLLGDGHANRTDTTLSNYMQGSDSEHQFARTLQFAAGRRLGYGRDFFHYDNATGYAGHSWRVMPVRNTTASPITITISARASDYTESGHEGACIAVFEPNTITYSTVTSVTGTRVAYSTTSSQNLNLTGSYTIPAGKTVLVCLTSTDHYMTTYRFRDTNYFYNLETIFPTGVICDLRMLHNLHNSRFVDLAYTGSFTPQISAIWKQCAVNYGDR